MANNRRIRKRPGFRFGWQDKPITEEARATCPNPTSKEQIMYGLDDLYVPVEVSMTKIGLIIQDSY